MKHNRYIGKEDLEDLATGATLLGSGGGGDVEYDLLLAGELVDRQGQVCLLDVADLADDDLIVPVAFMGAPLVGMEKLMSGKEILSVLHAIESHYGKAPRAVVAAEIGGSNALTPIIAAHLYGCDVVDADMLGRAFPELQMSSCALMGINASPAFIADSGGNILMLEAQSAKDVERLFRVLTTAMGSSAAIALYLMTGKEAKQALIGGSVSQAIAYGRKLKKGISCFNIIGTGIIADIEQDIQDGFLRGKITVTADSEEFVIDYQNEYLVLFKDGKPIVTTPDIIALLDTETDRPLSVEKVKFGLAVYIVAIDAPSIWKTDEGLRVVGPEAFGYSFSYSSMQEVV